MRAIPFVGVVVGIGLLGTGAWFLSRNTGAAGAAVSPSSRVASAGPAQDPAAAELLVPAVSPDQAKGRAAVQFGSETVPAVDPRPVLAEALEAILVGRVVDPVGRPIAGAEVHSGAKREVIGIERSDRATVTTRTDGEGRFELSAAGGEQELRVEAEGFVAARQQVRVKAGARKDLGDWELDPGVILEGIVLDPQRRPVPGAEIHRRYSVDQPGFTVVSSNGGPLVTKTDDSGRFRVASQKAGEYSFVVTTEAFPNADFDGETEAPGERVTGLEVLLEPGAEIRGSVIGLPEAFTDELTVQAQSIGGDGDSSELALSSFSFAQEERQAEVGSDGAFRLRGLREDTEYRLTARAMTGSWFFESSRTKPVLARAGETGVTLEYSPGATLAFQAVDASTGEPITEYEAEAGTQWLQPLVDGAGRVLRQHPDGRARFGGLRPESPGQRTELVLHAVGFDDYRVEDLTLTLGQTEDLGVLRMQRIPIVRVTALDARGVPVVGARVTLAPAREAGDAGTRSFRMRVRDDDAGADGDGGHEQVIADDDGSRSGRTDDNGLCELSSLPGETCSLRVVAPAYAPYSVDTIVLPVVDDFETTVRLTAGGIVEVAVVDADGGPVPGVRIEHRAKDRGRSMVLDDFEAPVVADEAGLARFEHLEAGPHLFRLDENAGQGGGFSFVTTEDSSGEVSTEGWEVIDVLGGETFALTLVASPRASLTGRVTEGGEPLVGAYVDLKEEGAEPSLGGPQIFGGGSGVKTDKTGAFEFVDRKAGAYTMKVTHATRAMPAEFDVYLFGGENRETVDLPVTVVTGRVTDEDGMPIAGVQVEAKRYEGESGGGRRVVMMMTMSSSEGGGSTMVSMGGSPAVQVMTDGEGRYELRGVAPDVRIFVEGSSDDHRTAGSDPFEVSSGATRNEVDFSLLGAGRIAVRALRSGQPVGDQLVRASFMGESAEPVSPEIAVLSGDGKAELTGLHVGAWSVRVTPFTDPNGTGGVEQRVEVRAGETGEALFELP